jgi:hypothetical protein
MHMSKELSRRIALRSLAAIAVARFGSAKAATPALTPAGVEVPHFGSGKSKACVPRVRERIKAVMNDKNPTRFEAQPPASNRPCK